MRRERAIAGAVAVAVVVAGGAWALAGAGCQLQGQCDADQVYVPTFPPGVGPAQFVTSQPFQAGAGIYPTANGDQVWQSSPIDGTWMSFPGQRSYFIFPLLPDGGHFMGPYTFPQTMISADPNPYTTSGSSFAQSAGNTAEFSGLPGNYGFEVTNNTCSPYYLWLQVAQEYPPEAGAPADAGPPDAPTLTDAPGDAE